MGSICEEVNKEVSHSKGKIMKVLIDTGCSLTLLQRNSISKHLYEKTKEKHKTVWSTNTGTFNTTHKCKINFKLLGFSPSRVISWSVHINNTNSQYDMIIGRDLQFALGLDIIWSKQHIQWDGLTCPLKTSQSITQAMKQVELFKQYEEIEQESYTSCSFVESTYEYQFLHTLILTKNNYSKRC